MNSVPRNKFFAAAALAVASLGIASAAHARTDVYLSIGVPLAPVYAQAPPVYAVPRPIYAPPRVVYVQPQPYLAPAVIYEGRSWARDDAPNCEEERAGRHAEWRRSQWKHHHGRDAYPSRHGRWDD